MMERISYRRLAFAALVAAVAFLCVQTPLFAQDIPTSSINEEGEYTYLPEDALSGEDLDAGDASIDSRSVLHAGRADDIDVVELEGANRWGTAAKQALYAYNQSDTVIVASGYGWPDALAAGGLAGALDCPILLSDISFVPDVTASALRQLGAKNIILLGSESVATDAVVDQLEEITGGTVQRLCGVNRYETQMAIYRYGVSHGLWTGDTAIISYGGNFADALAISPVSFALKAPVFFCDDAGDIPDAQLSAIKGFSDIDTFLITGSSAVVSDSTLDALDAIGGQRGGYAVRLGGANRYETSISIATYAVEILGFSWDGAGFASGQVPYDSLGGGVVQGKDRSVLLLADSNGYFSVTAITNAGGTIDTAIKFFGSTAAIPSQTRTGICSVLGISMYSNVVYTKYAISRTAMAQLQVNRNEPNSYTQNDFYKVLDPSQHAYGSSTYYQFAILNGGYSGVSAQTINQFIQGNVSWSESTYGNTSALRDSGQFFVDAANEYGVNEVYLMAHAAFESGWGCSDLASGWTPSADGEVIVNGVHYPYYAGTTYYNFFGIGAVDSNALSGGRAMAVKEGWTSPRAAILGAANWISANYHNRSAGRQNTLYLMKWDLEGAVRSGSAWHEYCTGIDTWTNGISRIMNNCYTRAGYTVESVPVTFDVPLYSGN